MAIAALKVASKSSKEIQTILTKLINGEPTEDNKEIDGILKRTKTLVTSSTSWPARKKYTINMLFNTNEIRKFSSLTENFFKQESIQ